MAEVAGDAVPAAQRSSWTTFIKSLASVSGDLSSMTAPPFILSPVSLTEFPAYWCERPELFAAIADGKNEEERSLAVLKWFLSTLKGQYTSRNESMGSEKKPLNPVLGELFYGYWPDKGYGRTELLVEQVSHHPPVTAYVIENKSKGVRLEGHNGQKTTFSSGNIIVKQIGHAILKVARPTGEPEEYLLTFPKLKIEGMWYGSPYIEVTDTTSIVSSTKWVANINYSGKGYFSGKSHSFKATLTPPASGTPHTIEGQWHTSSKLNHQTFHDVSGAKQEVQTGPVESMDPWESRKLWKVVAKGIRDGDFDIASKEKTRIENEQRQLRKDETSAGTPWKLKHFEHVDSDPTYARLAKVGGIAPAIEEAFTFKGNWPSTPAV